METINTSLDVAFVTFTFSDSKGNVFASFEINPTDTRLHRRAKNLGAFFGDLGKQKPSTLEEINALEDSVEQKFCELFGYDCRDDLFRRVGATDILGDGRMFAAVILDTLQEKLIPEIQRRRRANIDKYAAKYTGGEA